MTEEQFRRLISHIDQRFQRIERKLGMDGNVQKKAPVNLKAQAAVKAMRTGDRKLIRETFKRINAGEFDK